LNTARTRASQSPREQQRNVGRRSGEERPNVWREKTLHAPLVLKYVGCRGGGSAQCDDASEGTSSDYLGRPACVHPRGHGTSGVEPCVDLNLLRVTLIPAPSSIRSPQTPSRSTPWSSHVLGRLPSTLVLDSQVNHTALSRPSTATPNPPQPLKPHTLLGKCKVAARIAQPTL
jgi:hypothetical protein